MMSAMKELVFHTDTVTIDAMASVWSPSQLIGCSASPVCRATALNRP